MGNHQLALNRGTVKRCPYLPLYGITASRLSGVLYIVTDKAFEIFVDVVMALYPFVERRVFVAWVEPHNVGYTL